MFVKISLVIKNVENYVESYKLWRTRMVSVSRIVSPVVLLP